MDVPNRATSFRQWRVVRFGEALSHAIACVEVNRPRGRRIGAVRRECGQIFLERLLGRVRGVPGHRARHQSACDGQAGDQSGPNRAL